MLDAEGSVFGVFAYNEVKFSAAVGVFTWAYFFFKTKIEPPRYGLECGLATGIAYFSVFKFNPAVMMGSVSWPKTPWVFFGDPWFFGELSMVKNKQNSISKDEVDFMCLLVVLFFFGTFV